MKHHLAPILTAVAAALVGCQEQAVDSAGSTTSRLLLSGSSGSGSGFGPGPGAQAHAGTPDSRGLVIQDGQGGEAETFQLQSVSFGRIVELWGKTTAGDDVRVAREFVIGDTYTGDGMQVQLVSQPVLGTDRLMIDEVVNDPAGGRGRFLALAEAAAVTATPVNDARVDGSGRLSVIPRNAALVLQFNDLVGEGSIQQLGAMLKVGSPAVVPFEARLAAHDLIGGFDAVTGEFHSTRVIVDFTLSSAEANRTSSGLGLNATGLPAGRHAGMPDAALVLPTVALTGVSSPLMSSGGKPLAVSPGSVDYSSASKDLIRMFSIAPSSGAYRGFLMDTAAPRLVAEAEVQLTAAPQQDPAMLDTFTLPRVQFVSFGCAGPAQVGDILTQPGVVAEVIADSAASTAGGLDSVVVRLLEFPAAWTGPEQWQTDGVGVAFYQAPYDLMMDDRRIACLVGVTPMALGGMQAPTRGVSPDSLFELRFNEPIGANGSDQLESVLISRTPIPPMGTFDGLNVALAVGSPFGMGPLTGGYLVRPLVPLAHEAGASEVYYLTPRLGESAVRDLAGNPLLESPGPIAMSVDPSFIPITSGSAVVAFDRSSELGVTGAAVSGQVTPSFGQSRIRPRPVVRFQGNVDRSQPVLQQYAPVSQGVRTPFNPFGARQQTIWRYCDMGLGLTDPNTINIDVEGLYWAPSSSTLLADSFAEFEMKLSHSHFAPDEYLDPNSFFPEFGISGLRPVYAVNVLGDEAQEVVHPRQLGYTFSPGDLILSPSGETLAPFPLNRVANEPKRTFTWRDTTKRGRAGPGSEGVEPLAFLQSLGVPAPTAPYFSSNEIQTIGLPLLLDISTFPDATASGLNGWVLNLAANSSSRPYFRAFSAGGLNTQGNSVIVDPDAETVANGGFRPDGFPPGQATFGLDNSVLLGAADFVVRKSVAHSVWVDTGGASTTRVFSQPVVSTPFDQPLGAAVRADVRGAYEILYDNSGSVTNDNDTDNSGVADMLEDAHLLDLYGDFYNEVDGVSLTHRVTDENPGITFTTSSAFPVGSDWRADANTIDGARYVQLRLTMESDIETGATPSVDAMGIAWIE